MSQTVKCFIKVIIGNVSQSINKFDKEGKTLFLLVRLAYRNFTAFDKILRVLFTGCS